jgi:hypothetical protein
VRLETQKEASASLQRVELAGFEIVIPELEVCEGRLGIWRADPLPRAADKRDKLFHCGGARAPIPGWASRSPTFYALKEAALPYCSLTGVGSILIRFADRQEAKPEQPAQQHGDNQTCLRENTPDQTSSTAKVNFIIVVIWIPTTPTSRILVTYNFVPRHNAHNFPRARRSCNPGCNC